MIIKKEHKLCPCCMTEHEVCHVCVPETNTFKNQKVEYMAVYEYCDLADEYIATEVYLDENDLAMKNAYREKIGLLTTDELKDIRRKYGISQTDLAVLLGWGEKTITRYEGHQVQDAAHDAILKKINADPEWYLSLLEERKLSFSDSAYAKYRDTAAEVFERQTDVYLRNSILSQYAKFNGMVSYCGGMKLNIDKVVDVVRYLANSADVLHLFKVKLMKMLWYIDALSFKRRGVSLTGLAYKAWPMGAVPVAHDLLMDLQGIRYEEVDFSESTGYHFISDGNMDYPALTDEDMAIVDVVIRHFGRMSKDGIVQQMHRERAYTETALYDVIQYGYAKELSIE